MAEECKQTRKILEKKLDIALKNRNLEIQLFWQRSNYFLVLNSAIALAFFSFIAKSGGDNKMMPIAMAIFGLIASFLWIRILLGGKFWQSYWESTLKSVERRLWGTQSKSVEERPKDDLDPILFDNDSKHNTEVVEKFISKECSIFNKYILAKPSVSKIMVFLSICFMVFWIFLLFCAYHTGQV